MTPAERALLLAVAKAVSNYPRTDMRNLWTLIAAVEAEAAPEAPVEAKSCETCSSYLAMYDKCLYPRDGECLPTHKYWQPKPTEADVCPTCNGAQGQWVSYRKFWQCPDCGGTGRKEKK